MENIPSPNVHWARAEKLCPDESICPACDLKITVQSPDGRQFSLSYETSPGVV